MISIKKATENDYESIVNIGKISVAESHKNSSPDEVMKEYLENSYNNDAIRQELSDFKNIYHIIRYDSKPVGFSKIILNANHEILVAENFTKLDPTASLAFGCIPGSATKKLPDFI